MDQHTPLLDQNLPAQAPATATAPAGQLALLCAVRFIDPLTFTQIFPYINQFLSHLHLIEHQSQIGFYSGLVESTFAFFQLCSIYQWAHLSDSIGRRPVILAGTFGLAVATVFLGFAASLPAILLSRSLAGICSGIAAVLHAVLGELTNPSNQATAFPIYGLFWPLGNIVGPLIGGALADPAAQFPGVFDYPFFRDYPYFLPCFVTGMFALLVGVLVACYLEETLPSKRAGRNHSVLQESPSTVESTSPQVSSQVRFQPHLDAAGLNDAPPPMTMAQLLRIPVIRALTFSGVALCFTATAFDALFVLFCYTPIHLGGLSFSVRIYAHVILHQVTNPVLGIAHWLLPRRSGHIVHINSNIVPADPPHPYQSRKVI
ncbi:Major facilitator-type transporter psiT2 [Psilocybe cubensis]|uniref:Major facilitator-type transporter psiT2 n=1 Tax=Psilocybe cubensis TaxID=181762 RepID=A0ACB8H8N1_PSICU|nr:Major facilitator-type transporter psiT2 [Psilocybe cubensis]KAH9484153.1 Major facilitator-type transporter psiT2 [Psilocybe cubensis]